MSALHIYRYYIQKKETPDGEFLHTMMRCCTLSKAAGGPEEKGTGQRLLSPLIPEGAEGSNTRLDPSGAIRFALQVNGGAAVTW